MSGPDRLPPLAPAALLACAATVLDDARACVAQSSDPALHLDLALGEHTFATATGDPDRRAARAAFGRAAELLRAARNVPPWLYGGAAHAGWTALALGLAPGGLAAVDGIVEHWVAEFPADEDVDLPRGLLGLGVYALTHPDPRLRQRITAGVLDVVEARARHDRDGSFVPLARNPVRTADGSAGAAPVGVAHGAAGLAAYLASVVAAGLPCSARATSLVAAVVRWLLRQRVPPGSWRETGYEPHRSTWCYGDPGIAVTLAVVAEVTGAPAVRRLTAELAAQALARPPESAGVTDACLCHGAAGLAWIGRRAMDADCPAPSREAARRFAGHWAHEVVRARATGPLRYFRGPDTAPDASFLEGHVGVVVCLLHAAYGGRPVWEQRLLAARITVLAEQP